MNSNQMEDIASGLQCAAGTKSIISQTWDYQKSCGWEVSMDQDMKSNNLDVHLGHMEFTSGPFGDQKGNNSTC